ncbi:MAG: hypothetical protein ACLFU2_03315 [Opitutales bacterium]
MLGLFLGACSSTRMEETWTAPEVGSITFDKVLIIAAVPEGELRRTAEETIRDAVPEGVEAVASYRHLPEANALVDRAYVESAADDMRADGVVVLRPVARLPQLEESPDPVSPLPPLEYRTFRDYYRDEWALTEFSAPLDLTQESLVAMEVNLYELPEGRLIWSGVTSSRSPDNLEELVAEVAEAVRARMVEQGLIP